MVPGTEGGERSKVRTHPGAECVPVMEDCLVL